jgi:dTDP-glucose 4,6-dehydratase
MKTPPPTVLITGGAGFIGSNLVMHLLEHSDWHIVNLDALTYAGNLDAWGDWRAHPRHQFAHGSILDAALVKQLMEQHRPSAVLHLAAESHVDRSIDGPSAFVQTNVCGTAILLEQCLHHWQTLPLAEKTSFRFIHLSTDEVHGSLAPDDAPFTESTRYAPRSPYAATKAAADHLVRAWHHTYGFPTIVANASNNYGPRQFPEKLIPLAIVKMLRDEPIPLYGDGSQIRDWLHVHDHCRALHAILERGKCGESYVIGSGVETSNRDLLHQLCALMDEMAPRPDGSTHTTTITSVTDRPGHDQRYAIDATHIRNHLAWQPQHNLSNGLRSTLAWYLNHTAWWQSILDQRYHLQRFGSITRNNEHHPIIRLPSCES